MKKVMLGIVMLILLSWFAFPWCYCSMASGGTSLTGAQLLFQVQEVAAGGYYSDNPSMSEILQIQVYLFLNILIGVGVNFFLRDNRSPRWFWITALVVSIACLAILFMAFANIATTSILIGAYIAFFASLALIITTLVGALVKRREGRPEAIPH